MSLFLPVFISAQNVIPEPAQYRPAKGEFVLSIAENKALETNNVLPSRVVQRIAPDCTTGADEAYRLEITPDSVFIQSVSYTHLCPVSSTRLSARYSRLVRISRFMSQAKGLNQQNIHTISLTSTSMECHWLA